MQKFTIYILKILTAIMMVILFAQVVQIGINKNEQNECNRWAEEAQKYPGYYLLSWQKSQCDHYGIEIEIPSAQYYSEVVATVYAYNSEVEQTDSDPLIMASGNVVYDGAIACPEFIRLKTAVEIDDKIYICEDRMAERYRNGYNFDIWMANKQEAIDWGVQKKIVKIYN